MPDDHDPCRRPQSPTGRRGFTLLELLAVIGCLLFGAMLLLPALAGTHPNGRAFQCLNNQRKLMTAWRMYADENRDRVPNNFGVVETQMEVATKTYRTWANNVMDWTSGQLNTNVNLAKLGPLAPYLNGQTDSFRCPADNFLSPAQRAVGFTARTRSVSMNGFFGLYSPTDPLTASGKNMFLPSYRQWLKIIEVPQPANFFVLIDEHPDSINEGYFLNNPSPPGSWGDIPASLHNGACTLSYADGHGECHKWLSNSTKLPVRFSYSAPAFDALGQADFQWLIARTAVLY